MTSREKQLRKNLELANQELKEWRLFKRMVLEKLKKYDRI
jgi:hypothetical protein